MRIPGNVGPRQCLPREGEEETRLWIVFTLHEWGQACALVWGVSLSLAGVTLPLTVTVPRGPRAPWEQGHHEATLGGQTQSPGTGRHQAGRKDASAWAYLTTEGSWITIQSLLKVPTTPHLHQAQLVNRLHWKWAEWLILVHKQRHLGRIPAYDVAIDSRSFHTACKAPGKV